MKNFKIIVTLLLATASISALTFSCKKESNNQVEDNFQKSTLMKNVADNIILTEYNALDQKLNAFESAYQTFISNQNQSNFDLTKEAWIAAYLQWEKSLMFEFWSSNERSIKVIVGNISNRLCHYS